MGSRSRPEWHDGGGVRYEEPGDRQGGCLSFALRDVHQMLNVAQVCLGSGMAYVKKLEKGKL